MSGSYVEWHYKVRGHRYRWFEYMQVNLPSGWKVILQVVGFLLIITPVITLVFLTGYFFKYLVKKCCCRCCVPKDWQIKYEKPKTPAMSYSVRDLWIIIFQKDAELVFKAREWKQHQRIFIKDCHSCKIEALAKRALPREIEI